MTKGAPDILLARCTRERVGTGDVPLTDERRRAIADTVDRLADEALRTLAVAYRNLEASEESQLADEALERQLVFAGVVGMIDTPRTEAAEAIADAQGAGVRVVMITGDHARTAARIAGDLGIGTDAVEGPAIDGMDDERLAEVARETSVYAPVAP